MHKPIKYAEKAVTYVARGAWKLFEAANRSPRMQDLYSEYLNNWKNAGGDLFLHYTDVSGYTKYGSFGSLESQDQDSVTAPKYRALMNFAEQNP